MKKVSAARNPFGNPGLDVQLSSNTSKNSEVAPQVIPIGRLNAKEPSQGLRPRGQSPPGLRNSSLAQGRRPFPSPQPGNRNVDGDDIGECTSPGMAHPVHFADIPATMAIDSQDSPFKEPENLWNDSKSLDWLEVPILFYLFTYLIQWQELLQKRRRGDEARQDLDTPFTSPDRLDIEAEQAEVEREITFACREVDGILLNPLFVSWSKANLRILVRNVVKSWQKEPNSRIFEEASFQLLDAITEERKGKIVYSWLYQVREFFGAGDRMYYLLAIFVTCTIISLLCIVFLGAFGRKHLAACIALSVVLGVSVIINFLASLLILHHNTYSDYIAGFFREKALFGAKATMDSESFDETVMSPNFNAFSVIPALPPSDFNRLQKDRNNSVLLSGVNYAQHAHAIEAYQEQQLRNRIESKGTTSDIHSVAGKICVTALVYCEDDKLAECVALSLWKQNLTVLRSTLESLDDVFHKGSERFKVFLVHAPDVWKYSESAKMVMSWVIEEKRPVLFFCKNVSEFPPEVPPNSRLEIPLTERDMVMLVLRGMGVDEELNRSSISSTKPLKVPAYTLGKRIGGGAFGNVFEATIDETGAKCAVKRMYLRENDDDSTTGQGPSSQLLEIAQEVEIMSSLSHPNIVQYMFCERHDRCISIFMELCTGGSLSALINNGSLCTSTQIRRVLLDIIGAVSYLHNKRIVHRDLKPDNVLFRDGRAKVMDFGTAVHKSRENLSVFKGTVAYMAPEIIVGEPYGKACDLWSIGCIAAEILCVDLPQRSLGLVELSEFYRGMGEGSVLQFSCDVPLVRDFLLSVLKRNPVTRMTAQQLLTHEMLQPNNTELDKWIGRNISRWTKKQEEANRRQSFDLDSGDDDRLESV